MRLRLVLALGFAIYLAIPGYPRRALDGLPFDAWPDYVALVAGLYLFLPRWRETGPRSGRIAIAVVLLAILLRLAAGLFAVERGLSACYRPRGEEACARSTEFPERSDTRLDDRVEFESLSAGRSLRWFPVDFLFERSAVDALQHRIDVVWTGWYDPPRPGSYVFRLDAEPPGWFEVGGTRSGDELDLELGADPVPLRIAYAFVPVEPASIRFSVVEPGAREPNVAVDLFADPPPDGWRSRDAGAVGLDLASVALALGLVGWIAAVPLGKGRGLLEHLRTDRGLGLVLWTAAFLFGAATLFREALQDPVSEVVHASDPGIYENQAKMLVLRGLGSGVEAAHRSPVMRHYVRALHGLGGAGSTYPLLWQGALYALAAVLLFRITVARTGSRAAGAAVALALGWNGDLFGHAAKFLPDPLGMILVIVAVAALDRFSRGESRWSLPAGAFAYGLAALTRSDLLAGAPVILARAALPPAGGRRGWLAGGLRTAVAAALLALPFAALGLENRCVTGAWRFLPTSGPINFLMGNNIPRAWFGSEAHSGTSHDVLLDRLYDQVAEFDSNPCRNFDPAPLWAYDDLDPYLSRAAACYVREHPGHFAGQVGRKFDEFFWQGRMGRHFLPYTVVLAAALLALWRTRGFRAYAVELALLALTVSGLLAYRFHERHKTTAAALILLLAGPLVAAAWRRIARVLKPRGGTKVGGPGLPPALREKMPRVIG